MTGWRTMLSLFILELTASTQNKKLSLLPLTIPLSRYSGLLLEHHSAAGVTSARCPFCIFKQDKSKISHRLALYEKCMSNTINRRKNTGRVRKTKQKQKEKMGDKQQKAMLRWFSVMDALSQAVTQDRSTVANYLEGLCDWAPGCFHGSNESDKWTKGFH